VKPVFTIFAFALIVCSSSVSAETARQADIERKSANVMPFSMGETHHIFTPTANGGTQVVMVMDGNPKQLGLVRSHLRKEAIAFAAGNFTDPATLHGAAMPGLAMLRHSRGRLDVRYSDIAAGGKIAYASHDPRTIAALHQWFAAQVSDHGSHATMKM
jgi:hypothetical protein